MSNQADLFGPVIYRYSRAQAINDGALVDLTTRHPKDTRIYKYPVACTASVWALVEKAATLDEDRLGSRAGEHDCYGLIVWDLCFMSVKMPISRPDPTTVVFEVIIGFKTHTLKAVCGPDDNMNPCITIMGINED
jgi:hypothetical protein